MKSSLLATGLVGVAIIGLWFVGGGTQPLPTAQAEAAPQVGKPQTHENLTIYFLRGSDAMPGAMVLSLPEALERELAVVHETSDVNMLAVENKSEEYELFIQSGDIVKGGKQDRMAQTDMLLPPKSGVVPLPAHCVEQGRWTARGGEDSRQFKSSTKFAVGYDMKVANATGMQSAVWQSVSENQTKLNTTLSANVNSASSPSSFQLSLESPQLTAKVTEYEAALKAAGETDDTIIGVVFAVNGNVTGAEVYGSNAIFRKAWPKLLNSAAVEAVTERGKPLAGAPSPREVEGFLARVAEPTNAANNPAANNLLSINDVSSLQDEPRAGNVRTEGETRTGQFVFQAQIRLPVAQTEGRLPQTEGRQLTNPAPNQPPPPLPAPNSNVQAQVQIVDVQFAQIGGNGNATPRPAQPMNSNGNRLSTNVNVSGSTLMLESRDPARKNVIIHRSYLKK